MSDKAVEAYTLETAEMLRAGIEQLVAKLDAIRDGLPGSSTGHRRVNRILRNAGGETVDEIVVTGCTFHIEQLDDDSYYINIDRGGEPHLTVNLRAKGSRLLVTAEDQFWAWDEDREHEG